MSGIINTEKSRCLRVALVGSPNSGKTTLYNWLTGSNFKTVNYPGATIEYAQGQLQPDLKTQFQQGVNFYDQVLLYDTPGIYSLFPKSADEEVTLKILSQTSEFQIDLVLLVMDSTQLNRQLKLAVQLKESKIPFQMIYTMNDLATEQQMQIDVEGLQQAFGQKAILNFDGLLGKGLKEIVQFLDHFQKEKYVFTSLDPSSQARQQRVNQSHQLYKRCVQWSVRQNHENAFARTLKWDQILLHPIWGLVIFITVMTVLFASIYWFAKPFMDLIENLFSSSGDFLKLHIPGLIGEFIVDGLWSALGGVLVFIPQIFILFLGLGILENTGYLARVATLIDRPLTKVGLGGRSFVPLLSGFACAVPALMATRNIRSKKEKTLAQFIIPFMTCSARLPVYGLMIGFLFADQQPFLAGFVLALLYFSAILISAIVSGILSRLIKSKDKASLAMDLPLYRRPQIKVLFRQSVDKSKSFIFRAGPIIFILAVVLWFAAHFPHIEGENITAEQKVEQSYAGRLGHVLQPVFEPMGLDWRAGFGIISAFAAREVFVSSLALVFNVEADESAQEQSLLERMKQAEFQNGPRQGQKIFTVSSSVGILIFFMIALQCLSTYAVLKKESGGHQLALLQLLFSNALAYILAVSVVQGLRALGVA